MLIFLSIISGLIAGSFLNVVINRLKTGESFNGRSHCPHCGRQLEALDLVPLISYLYLGGKCRHCKAEISAQYPLVEVMTALAFALLAIKFGGFGYQLVFECILAAFFIVIAVYDFKHFLILDKVVFPGLAVAFAYAITRDLVDPCGAWQCSAILSGLLGALIISGFFFLQYVVSKGKWIGFGDVKFGLMLGVTAGFPGAILLLFSAYMLGALAGVGLIAMGRKQMGSKLPFGTFLAITAIITMLYGQPVIDWYMNLIGL